MRATLVAAVVAAASTAMVAIAPPVQAVESDRLTGHRCRTYPATATNEDTVAALIDTSGVAGAWCEVDVRKLADGTMIIWHDPTWERVADAGSLVAAGLSPTDAVANATWAQVSQIRTKGGEPVATLAAMIDASAAYSVPLVVEVKTTMTEPASWVTYARERGTDVRYYQTPSTTRCKAPTLISLRDAGAAIGVRLKPGAPCQMTATQVAVMGGTFVSQTASKVTEDYARAMHSSGVALYVRDATAATSRDLLSKGSDRLIVNDPRVASTW